MTSETKTCQNCKNQFTVEPEDFDFYKKISVPPPTWCPECRLERRLLWRNERTLYKRKCDLCGKDMLSIYSDDKDQVVYCPPCWWSDKWDSLAYGRDYDFSRSFFEQFRELHRRVPLPALNTLHLTLTNSEYVNQAGHLKNCYLIFNSDYNEGCCYGTEVEGSKDCFDNLMIDQCELAYGCVNCRKCSRVFFSVDCESCQNVYFSRDLIGCDNCFGCVGLRNKKYHIFNQPFSKEDYEAELVKFDIGTFKNIGDISGRAEALVMEIPKKYIHGRQNTNVSGDYINHCRDVFHSYVAIESQNCKHCLWLIAKPVKDCWDYTEYGDAAERVYETLLAGKEVGDIKMSVLSFNATYNTEYSNLSYASNNLFSCASLRNKQFCILNKQYSEAEYKNLREKIIEQMNELPYKDKQGREYRYGEFFPPELSPFAYNETTAVEIFPLTKERTLAKGYKWQESKERDYKVSLTHSNLPNHIKDVDESILKETIGCAHEGKCNEQCTKAFKIIEPELQFYRKMNLPLPRLCPNCRHYERLKQRNPLKLWHRQCTCAGQKSENSVYQNTAQHFHGDNHCPNEFETSYAPERPEIVYCEQCYQAEVV